MTELTRQRILTDLGVFAAAIGPIENGKFGIYIGTTDKSPSGNFDRPRVLLTSNGECATSEDAVAQGRRIIAEIREDTYVVKEVL